MKLTPEQKLIELAKMDGWAAIDHELYGYIPDAESLDSQGALENKFKIPNYPTSYDAIIPLIQKQNVDTVGKIISIFGETFNGMGLSFMQWCAAGRLLKATPSQLSDALLKAKGFEI